MLVDEQVAVLLLKNGGVLINLCSSWINPDFLTKIKKEENK